LRLIARIIAEKAHSTTGIDIHPGATIGNQFFVDHGTGVVIGETALIGERVRLYQAVTLGAVRFPEDGSGSLKKGEPRHPIVEDDVWCTPERRFLAGLRSAKVRSLAVTSG
jgi:serine O-acetyltransferase